MSDSNNPHEALKLHDPEALYKENESLRQRLARLEHQNVIEGRFEGEAPRYLVNDPGVYLDDTHWVGGTTIDFIGEPNLSMVPLNDPAKRAMADLIERLETGARKVAARQGRDFFGLVTDRNVLVDTAMMDAKAAAAAPIPTIQVPQPTQNIPAMPHTEDAQSIIRRGVGRPRKVVSSQPAAPQGAPRDFGAPTLAPAPSDPAIIGRMVR